MPGHGLIDSEPGPEDIFLDMLNMYNEKDLSGTEFFLWVEAQYSDPSNERVKIIKELREKLHALQQANKDLKKSYKPRKCLICKQPHYISVPIDGDCYKLMQLTQQEIKERYFQMEKEKDKLEHETQRLQTERDDATSQCDRNAAKIQDKNMEIKELHAQIAQMKNCQNCQHEDFCDDSYLHCKIKGGSSDNWHLKEAQK